MKKYYVFCAKGKSQNKISWNCFCDSLFNFSSLFSLELDPAAKPHSMSKNQLDDVDNIKSEIKNNTGKEFVWENKKEVNRFNCTLYIIYSLYNTFNWSLIP